MRYPTREAQFNASKVNERDGILSGRQMAPSPPVQRECIRPSRAGDGTAGCENLALHNCCQPIALDMGSAAKLLVRGLKLGVMIAKICQCHNSIEMSNGVVVTSSNPTYSKDDLRASRVEPSVGLPGMRGTSIPMRRNATAKQELGALPAVKSQTYAATVPPGLPTRRISCNAPFRSEMKFKQGHWL